jgi:hypothetical protein
MNRVEIATISQYRLLVLLVLLVLGVLDTLRGSPERRQPSCQ